MERKEIVKRLSEFLGVKSKYLGPPNFEYEIRTETEIYTIDRWGTIKTSAGRIVTLDEILNKGEEEQVDTEINVPGDTLPADEFELKLPLKNHTGKTLQNLVNMLSSKQHLIIKALKLTEPFMDETFAEDLSLRKMNTVEEFKEAINELGAERCQGLTFDFDKGTFTFRLKVDNLTHEKIKAFTDLAVLINNVSRILLRASFKKTQDDNPKYAFRTWIIRLGMKGEKYKVTRKELLKNLEGSGAFRNAPGESGD
jgi:hypothetical protein